MPWLVFTNLFVAFCGAALTAASDTALHLPIQIDAVVGLTFFGTLTIYNLDRLVEPYPGNTPHERWVHAHRHILWGITLASAIASLGLATQLRPTSLISLVLAGALAAGYCLPVVWYGGRWRRLKALPGAKVVFIALVWTYATAGLPMLERGGALDLGDGWVLAARFFFIAAVALPFDLPDMDRDRLAGIVTLPTLGGIHTTWIVTFVLLTISAAMSLLNPWPAAGGLLISCACVAGLVIALRPDRGVAYFMIALDGMLLAQAAFLWIIADWT